MAAASAADAFVTLAGALPSLWVGGLLSARGLPACLPADPDCDSCKLAGEGMRVTSDTCSDRQRRNAGQGAEDGAGRTVFIPERCCLQIDKGFRGFIICKYRGINTGCVSENTRYFCFWVFGPTFKGVKPPGPEQPPPSSDVFQPEQKS